MSKIVSSQLLGKFQPSVQSSFKENVFDIHVFNMLRYIASKLLMQKDFKGGIARKSSDGSWNSSKACPFFNAQTHSSKAFLKWTTCSTQMLSGAE